MAAKISLVQRERTTGSYQKGTSGNPAGRPRGKPNRVTTQAREMAALIVDDPEYREGLRRRMIAGTATHMEPVLWAYAKGKPVDRVETGGPGAFANLDDKELVRRLADAVAALQRQ